MAFFVFSRSSLRQFGVFITLILPQSACLPTPTHLMYAHITRFLDYMSGQRGCSPLTRSTYEDSLTACADYLIARHPTIAWETVDTGHVREWLAHLMRSNYAPNTVNRSLSALRSFYRLPPARRSRLLRSGTQRAQSQGPQANPRFCS